MNKNISIKLLLLIFLFSLTTFSYSQIKYPKTKKISHTDNYFGREIRDDYQWMEVLESPDVKVK